MLITGGETGTKNHEARTIPLFAPLARLVESMRERKHSQGEALIFEIENARLQIIRACERLGLPRFGHHTMRHFFCSNAIEAGCDFKVIAGWLGHKDGGVLVAMTYGHLAERTQCCDGKTDHVRCRSRADGSGQRCVNKAMSEKADLMEHIEGKWFKPIADRLQAFEDSSEVFAEFGDVAKPHSPEWAVRGSSRRSNLSER